MNFWGKEKLRQGCFKKTFLEIDDNDLLSNVRGLEKGTTTTTQSEPSCSLRRMIKKSEVQYTQDIESILEQCIQKKQPLDATHTVSLQDVKRNLDAWSFYCEEAS